MFNATFSHLFYRNHPQFLLETKRFPSTDDSLGLSALCVMKKNATTIVTFRRAFFKAVEMTIFMPNVKILPKFYKKQAVHKSPACQIFTVI